MKQHLVNVPEHMLKIKQALEVPGAEEDLEEVERKEGLLEELLEIVENIDHAKGETPQLCNHLGMLSCYCLVRGLRCLSSEHCGQVDDGFGVSISIWGG